ncbi:MAG: ABC transporter ATP-binding protein [Alphaproteobacteria bacterium]|nr:ABC transporter ATP-binding protein [Alphaproteobacteria bacterium]
MIEVRHISKNFGTHCVLDDVNFCLKTGEVTALIGENGAGKSTLMRIISGYLKPTGGEVKIFDKDIGTQRIEALSHIGYVPEISSLYGEMRVYDFLVWITKLRLVLSFEEAILKAAKQMKIMDVLDEKIENLSKGFKKRVEIAAAISYEPQFLILDEPTDGLDPIQKLEIRDFMKEYAKKNTVLVSTHVLEDVDKVDRVLMLSSGRLIKDTTITDFKKISKNKNLSEAFRILSSQIRTEK